MIRRRSRTQKVNVWGEFKRIERRQAAQYTFSSKVLQTGNRLPHWLSYDEHLKFWLIHLPPGDLNNYRTVNYPALKGGVSRSL